MAFKSEDSLNANQPEENAVRPLRIMLPEHMSESVLWKLFRTGDEQALIIIFDRYGRGLYNYGYKIFSDADLVKDAIQELFIELWKNKANLGDTDCIKNYLYKSLRRKLVRVKAKSGHSVDVDSVHEAALGNSPSFEFTLISQQGNQEQKERVNRMLAVLTKRQREAIFLRFYEEMSYDKIAEVMDLSKQAVYNLVNKSLQQLRRRGNDESPAGKS